MSPSPRRTLPADAADPLRGEAESILRELTALPTAAGREARVVDWVEAWARRRRNVELDRDGYGNLLLRRRGVSGESPIVFAAHLDHPAFVVVEGRGREVVAEFRGGVQEAYFVGTRVRGYRSGPGRESGGQDGDATPPGRIESYTAASELPGGGRGDPRVTVRFRRDPGLRVGDILTWDLGATVVRGDRVHAPACDDLAAVAAMFVAFGRLLSERKSASTPDVRLLYTRAEEVGFIGAMGACRSGLIPRGARIVALENSKSFAESPLGGGPIVRVGDRVSTFDPGLTYRVAEVARQIGEQDAGFVWQRKLMAGGACEATAYQTLGYTATCVCLPLGNYHNMDEAAGKIAREVISLRDYHGMVTLLVAIGQRLDQAAGPDAGLRGRLDRLFETRESLLG